VSFLLTDQEGDPADCRVFYEDGGSGGEITLAAGSAPLSAVPSGAHYSVLWNFAADLGSAAYEGDLALRLEVVDGISPAPLSPVEVGNDAPEVLAVEALPAGQGEYSGNVDLRFTIRDTAGDPVNVRVEYNDDATGGFPSSAWKLARPASTPLADATPDYAITDFAPSPTG